MDNIFEIKIKYELRFRDTIIKRFSDKQGGNLNVFSYYWQCFAWAAIIGFNQDLRRPLESPIERSFSLNTMRNTEGEKIAEALICMCIAKSGSLEIMKTPEAALDVISEYANGGFYWIEEQIESGEMTYDSFEMVKREVFSRPIN